MPSCVNPCLAAVHLAPVRKALHILLVMVCAPEEATALGKDAYLTPEEFILRGAELVNICASAWRGDLRSWDLHKMILCEDYWGGDVCFMQSKMTGQGTPQKSCHVCRRGVSTSQEITGSNFTSLECPRLAWCMHPAPP